MAGAKVTFWKLDDSYAIKESRVIPHRTPEPSNDSRSIFSKAPSLSSGPVTTAPFESPTPGETEAEMSHTSSTGKARLGEIEDPDEISLERYLDNADPYRSTSLPNPWPYPLFLENAFHLQQQLLPLQDEIIDILTVHGFPDNVEILPFVATKPRYPGGDNPVNLLRVALRNETYTATQLDTVKSHLLELLHAKGIMDMHVDIGRIDMWNGTSISPLSSRHPIVTAFEEAKHKIIQILDNGLGSKWNVLCPFGVEHLKQEVHPAIVVHVDPMTCANWAKLGSEIKKTVSAHVKDHPIEVNFLPGDLSMPQSGGVSFTDSLNLDGRPTMGHSVGIVGEQNAGTLGGYVTLTQGGKVHKGFLTNYHVVRPSGTEESLDRFGCTLLHPPAKDIQIESLAGTDRDATLFNIEQRMKTMNRQIEDFSIKIEEQEKIGARPPPMLKERIKECECVISDLREKHEVVQKMPHSKGRVATVSGQSILGRRLMDWAFVELPDEAAKEYFKPNKMFHVPPENMPHLYDISFGVPIGEGKLLNQVGRLEKDQFYLKLGRSTGVTGGICNGALACCNWQGHDRTRFQHDGQRMESSPDLTEEFVIVNKKVGQSNSQQMPFAESGDSGSLVIDIDGQVCGLLHGATSGFYGPPGQGRYYSNAGLAIDFVELSNSVKLRTLERDSDGNIVTSPAELALPGDS